ncbi:hypothetical protein PF004_g16479 [Phytophthora fragariae]|uniref:Uncharacterized protein n=1 Tax=Phytophthora fragariae TaxID=53985 RepID=A0A6G0NIA5_9STRA|nr:hypothetical protein PF004_g16479 [Phytophthora fragariae]
MWASAEVVLTGKSPPLGEIVVFGSPCPVYHDPHKKNFAQCAQKAMIVGMGEETKGVVVTTQHVKNIKTLDKEQNLQVQRLYLQGDKTLEGDEAPESEAQALVAKATSARSKKKHASSKKKKPWARERHVTRSVAKNSGGVTNEAAQSQEAVRQCHRAQPEDVPGGHAQQAQGQVACRDGRGAASSRG